MVKKNGKMTKKSRPNFWEVICEEKMNVGKILRND